jgi:hypothetical protein
VYYVGVSAEAAFYDDLLERLAEEVRIPRLEPLPPGVEVLERRGRAAAKKGARRILIIINYTGDPRAANIGIQGKNDSGKIGWDGPKGVFRGPSLLPVIAFSASREYAALPPMIAVRTSFIDVPYSEKNGQRAKMLRRG